MVSLYGGKTGSICHFAFSLVLQRLGVPTPKIPRCWEKQHEECSVEPKVPLQGYGYSLFCSHSFRCLAVLVQQYSEEAFCAPKVRLKWYGFKGVSSHSSYCSGGLFPQYSGGSPSQTLRAQRLKNFKILKFSSEIENFKRATHQTPFFRGEF